MDYEPVMDVEQLEKFQKDLDDHEFRKGKSAKPLLQHRKKLLTEKRRESKASGSRTQVKAAQSCGRPPLSCSHTKCKDGFVGGAMIPPAASRIPSSHC